MKKNFLWMLTAILTFCGAMLITSCSSDNDDPTETPDSDDVRLTKLVIISMSPQGDTLAVSTQHFTWEDGLLKKINSNVRTMLAKTNIATEDRFVYEGTDCTEILHGSGTHDYITYTDGRLTSAISVMKDGTTTRIDVNAYTADGHVSEMTKEYIDHEDTVKVSYTLTWENGDLTSYVAHHLDPAGDDRHYGKFTYYDAPSPFTGYPMAQYIWDAYDMELRGSKHYVQSGETIQYENGRIVVKTKESSTVYYTYSDGTGSALTANW